MAPWTHSRPPCLSPTPRVYSNSCPLNWWCHPTISSSVSLFFFCLQSFQASGSFPVTQLFTLGAQSIGDLASASVLLKSIWGWFSLRLTGSISLVPRDSQESSTAPLFENISSSLCNKGMDLIVLWRRLSAEELMLLNCGVGEDSWECLGLQGDPTSPFWRRSTLGFLWKEWC